jgi:hypothetical protein
VRITVEKDGVVTDITEGVQILYDAMVSTLDWGSGLLDKHEVLATWALARACGFGTEAYLHLPCDICQRPSYNHGRWVIGYDGHAYKVEGAPE